MWPLPTWELSIHCLHLISTSTLATATWAYQEPKRISSTSIIVKTKSKWIEIEVELGLGIHPSVAWIQLPQRRSLPTCRDCCFD